MSAATGYDVVIVGAGSAGCVLAARLTEDPGRRVLLLEAGGSDRNSICRVPGMVSIIHTVPQVKQRFDWGYKSNPRDWTLDRKIPQVRGKVVGGSSAINGMLYVRGHRLDYDGWAADGCPGWTWSECVPELKRLEHWEGGEAELRGGDGPIKVTRPPTDDMSPVSHAFMDAVSGAAGVDILDDYNLGDHTGTARIQLTCADGIRSSTSEGYLQPVLDRHNLTVVTGALVHRILLEGTRAVGVRYSVGDTVHEVRADQEVVLSAGALGSPMILMRSGIGPAPHLAGHGIDVAADLPVGDNLHDHLFFPMTFLAPRGGHKGTPWHFFGGMIRERLFGGTWFGRSVFETVAFLQTLPGLDRPDLQLHCLPWAYPSPNQDDTTKRPTVDMRPALTVQPTLIYPESRGEVRLTSADPSAPPIYDPHYLEAQADVETLMRGIALTREIMAHPAIAGEITAELHPGAEFADEAALRRELPNRVATVYHPVGTCRMGSDERAVVDPRLRVRGIEGLRVVDASVMPRITGGNTNAPSILIGERGAELIAAG